MDMTIIGTKWVYRNKLDENGVVTRNKARLVDQGYNQQEGIDYDETYAPVARLESIRILLAYARALDFKLYQMDVKSAFLNGFINEEVYVTQPSGFIDFAKPNYVYKLKKALYGLKQAPKAWYDQLISELKWDNKLSRNAWLRFERTPVQDFGTNDEDANDRIDKVLEIVDLFHMLHVTEDQLMMCVFPNTLTSQAHRCLKTIPTGLIIAGASLKARFLHKYCPPLRTTKKMEEINLGEV
ncbi:copia protein [Tanacetum coccineum]